MTLLTTERLVLRPLSMDDLDPLAALYADPAAVATCGHAVQTREETAARLREMVEHWRMRGFGSWAVTDRDTGAFIGECGLRRRMGGPEAELTLALAPGHRAWDLAAEAAQAALRHGFESLELDHVVALAPAGDSRQHQMMRRIGMTPEAKTPAGEAGPVKYALSRDAFLFRPAEPATALSERAEAARRERQERLARALRRNLRRRKDQDRGRGAGRSSGRDVKEE